MRSWQLQVEEHIAKILADPADLSVPHYLHELRTWIRDIERLKRYAGKKTGVEWDRLIEGWRSQVPELRESEHG